MDAYRVVMPWERGPGEKAQEGRRVAVLPFANMSPDPNDEYFADGMTEELKDRLAQVKSLRVISRTSVMKYKGANKGALEVARELSSGALVEGSVRKAGNRVRVTVQLINGGTEEHLWSSHYDGNLDDIFAVQSEIAVKVAGELKVQLLGSEKRTLEKKPTESTEAYSAFLRGRELHREQSEPSVRQALSLFQKAVELDPGFARAHVGIAECLISLTSFGEPLSAEEAARGSLARALELDPDLPEAHAALATAMFDTDDLVGAEAEAKRALELNPSLPDPYRHMFEIAATRGDPDGMVRSIEAAYRLDPVSPIYVWLLGEAYVWTGREREALEHWKKTEPISPAYTYRGLADYYLAKGEIEKAREYHSKFERLMVHPWATYFGGMIAAQAGEREKAALAIEKLEQSAKVSSVSCNYVAYVYHALGDFDSYFEWMNRAADAHAQVQSFLMYSPLLAKGRSDPRFQGLVERVRRQTGLSHEPDSL